MEIRLLRVICLDFGIEMGKDDQPSQGAKRSNCFTRIRTMISRPFSTLAISSGPVSTLQSVSASQMSFLHHDAENRLLSLFRKLCRWKEERVSRDGTTRRQDQIKELHSKLGKQEHFPARPYYNQPHRSHSIFYTDVSYSLDQGLASSSSAQPIQGAARFLSATSGLCSGRHSYVLLFAPYLRIQSTPPVLIRSGPWSSVSGLPADKISEIDQPAGLVWLFLSIEKKESAVCASHLLLGSAGRHGILV
ncbi:hypothetical protein VNO77_50739 [Canavalia gladiata]